MQFNPDHGRVGRPASVFPWSFGFQPIVHPLSRTVCSYEALLRGSANEPAQTVLARVPRDELYRFDREARAQAIELAASLGLRCNLNLNMLPRGLLESDESIVSALTAAERVGLPQSRLVLELTEGEVIDEYSHVVEIMNRYRDTGIKVSIDDFGAGYSGLNMLAEFQPDQIKLDMNLVRRIERDGPRQAIVRAVIQACGDLGIDVVAEGVESRSEYGWLSSEGVELFQGWLFARPGFECLPEPLWPDSPDPKIPSPEASTRHVIEGSI